MAFILSTKFKESEMPITEAQIDELLEGCTSPADILGEEGLLKQLTKRVAERALQAEMALHLGYEKHATQGNNTGNSRNGVSTKTVRTVHGEIEVDIPRDRNGTFLPQLIGKREKQLNGFDERIISLYARGMSVRDIQSHLAEAYGVDVSSTFISKVTDAVMEEVHHWQRRSLDSFYPVVYLDCLMVRSRDSGAVQNKAVYLALGINADGYKELLGLWMAQTEGAKFWLSVMNELKNRGVQDIFIACCDGLKGFPEAIEAAYPRTQIQLCIVHQVRHSLRFVSWKQRKEVAADLKRIYAATTLAQAQEGLDEFAARWDEQHPSISRSWRNNWERLTVFFDYPPAIRKVIYTTNAIESLNASLRKVAVAKRSFPNDDAVLKALFLALHCAMSRWTMPITDWKPAMNQFMIIYGERVTL